MNDRVIVVREGYGPVIKVCESWDAYNEWVEQSSYEKWQCNTSDCRVRKEQ